MGTSLVIQWLGLQLPIQGAQFQSLFEDPTCLMTNKPKQKQYCEKFNKDFKNGPHEKNLKRVKVNIGFPRQLKADSRGPVG